MRVVRDEVDGDHHVLPTPQMIIAAPATPSPGTGRARGRPGIQQPPTLLSETET